VKEMDGVLRVPVRRPPHRSGVRNMESLKNIDEKSSTGIISEQLERTTISNEDNLGSIAGQENLEEGQGAEDQVEEEIEYKILSVQPCINSKLCQAFPAITHEQRSSLRMDPEASFSITDAGTAADMTAACVALLSALPPAPRRALDGTAGAGGNTAALVGSGEFAHVCAYEMHPDRASDLSHNLHTLFPPQDGKIELEDAANSSCGRSDDCSWEVRAGSVVQLLQSAPPTTPWDVVFFDPPW
jgi:hypothetical protein